MSNGDVMGRWLCELWDRSWNLLFSIITMHSKKKTLKNICNSRVSCQKIYRCQLCNSHSAFAVLSLSKPIWQPCGVNLIQRVRVHEILARISVGQPTPRFLYACPRTGSLIEPDIVHNRNHVDVSYTIKCAQWYLTSLRTLGVNDEALTFDNYWIQIYFLI